MTYSNACVWSWVAIPHWLSIFGGYSNRSCSISRSGFSVLLLSFVLYPVTELRKPGKMGCRSVFWRICAALICSYWMKDDMCLSIRTDPSFYSVSCLTAMRASFWSWQQIWNFPNGRYLYRWPDGAGKQSGLSQTRMGLRLPPLPDLPADMSEDSPAHAQMASFPGASDRLLSTWRNPPALLWKSSASGETSV